MKRKCSQDGCGDAHYARGWCKKHYTRWLAHGAPNGRASTNLDWLMDRLAQPFGDGCVYWPFARDRYGYGIIGRDNPHRTALVHRIAAARHGNDISGLVVRHRCRGARDGCFNPSHLEVGTHADNIADKLRDGTQLYGEQVHTHVLTERDVCDIRQRYGYGGDVTMQALADEYGVSRTAIHKVVYRLTWQHVDERVSS